MSSYPAPNKNLSFKLIRVDAQRRINNPHLDEAVVRVSLGCQIWIFEMDKKDSKCTLKKHKIGFEQFIISQQIN